MSVLSLARRADDGAALRRVINTSPRPRLHARARYATPRRNSLQHVARTFLHTAPDNGNSNVNAPRVPAAAWRAALQNLLIVPICADELCIFHYFHKCAGESRWRPTVSTRLRAQFANVRLQGVVHTFAFVTSDSAPTNFLRN